MTKAIGELRKSEFPHELGQKLCAAFIAQQQGISLSTALKKSAGPVGDLWFLAAEFAIQGYTQAFDLERFSEFVRSASELVM
jgi:hypothetical protein